MATKIILEEQGLRDGLQTIPTIVPTEVKLAWLDRLVKAGVQRIQVASFVHPRIVPQMADAAALFAHLRDRSDVVLSALVLNQKGVERATEVGVRHLAISLSASETHSLKNTRMNLETAKTDFRANVRFARQHQITVRAGIQCAFGCRYEGRIATQQVLDLVKHHLDTGADELALADSTGMANPRQLREMMQSVLELVGVVPVSLHLHNTENKGLANVYAGIEAGVRQFDTAFGGLGGCPFIQNATGNIATEDTVHLLHQMGYETGIDLPKIATLGQEIAQFLGTPLPGALYKLLQEPIQVC
ncbi:MAG: hydroxymethylglutaryl-CoA lyase [Rhodothermia bacterium]|nr:hydroxymethylglutaryl-CoA lyase [Rhodothermia bacterium]